MNLTFTLSEELANEIVSCLSSLIQTVQEETNICSDLKKHHWAAVSEKLQQSHDNGLK